MEKLIFNTDTSPFESIQILDPGYMLIMMTKENYYIMRHLMDSFNMDVGFLYKGHIYDLTGVYVEKANDNPNTYVYVHWHFWHIERLIFDPECEHPLKGTIHSGINTMCIEALINISQFSDECDNHMVYYILQRVLDYGDWIMYEGEEEVFYNDYGDKRIRDDLDVIDFN